MRAAFVITGRILRQRLRDRSAIIFAVLTPFGLALAFSFLIPNDSNTFHTAIAVVDEDGGPMATTLVDDAFGHLVEAGVADIEPPALRERRGAGDTRQHLRSRRRHSGRFQ